MWILTILPDWAIHTIFSLGVLGVILGFVLGFIPFISRYKLPIQIISLLVVSLGIYLEGGLANNKEWLLKVAEMEKKVAEAQVKSEKVNTEIITKVVTKDKIIREKGDEVVKYIEKEVVKVNNICPAIPKPAIIAHDAAALNKPIELSPTEPAKVEMVTKPVEAAPSVKTTEVNEAAKPPFKLPKK